MKYLSLTLEGYVPLLLNGVAVFSMLIEKDEQIILGSNGSAKSSVMRELSPLPAVKADYNKQGKKTLVLEDKGIRYTLISDFSGTNGKHTFIRGEDVLNDAGTSQIQTALVKQYLNYDAELHELMTDMVRFTRMSPQQRQHWITRISGADFSFAIQLYKSLKSDLRDAQGALKNVNQKLSSLVEQGVDHDKGIRQIDDAVKAVLLEIERLNQAKPFASEQEAELAKHSAMEQFQIVHNEIEAFTHSRYPRIRAEVAEIAKRYHFANGTDTTVREALLATLVRERETELAVAKEKLRSHKEDYARIASVIEQIESLGAHGVADIETSLKELAQTEASLSQTVVSHALNAVLPLSDSVKAANQQFQAVRKPLQAAFQQLPLNQDKALSLSALQSIQTAIQAEEALRGKYVIRLEQIQHRLNHIENAHSETCPNCQYSFIPGVSSTDKQELLASQEKGQALLKALDEKLVTLNEEKERQQEFQQHVNGIRQLFQQAPLCRDFFHYLISEGLVEGNAAQCIGTLLAFDALLTEAVKLEDTKDQRKYQEAALQKLKALPIPEGNMADVSASAESSLQLAIERVEEAEKRYVAIQEDQERYTKLVDYSLYVQTLSKTLSDARRDVSNATRMDGISETLKHHYGWLTALYEEKRVLSTAGDLIKDYTQEKNRLEGKITTLTLLTDHLSPKSGLIADVILRFINEFVDTINDVIQSVWTYDLRLIAPSLDDESQDLDYKFPLQVRNSPRPVKDVLLASAGQEDMINFAFKIAALGFMGCQDYPLLLDELSPHLDETHRILITQYVAKLLNANRCSQLFMISHFQAGHGAFVNAQYCVMDPSNITLPTVYNEHVSFTKVA